MAPAAPASRMPSVSPDVTCALGVAPVDAVGDVALRRRVIPLETAALQNLFHLPIDIGRMRQHHVQRPFPGVLVPVFAGPARLFQQFRRPALGDEEEGESCSRARPPHQPERVKVSSRVTPFTSTGTVNRAPSSGSTPMTARNWLSAAASSVPSAGREPVVGGRIHHFGGRTRPHSRPRCRCGFCIRRPAARRTAGRRTGRCRGRF